MQNFHSVRIYIAEDSRLLLGALRLHINGISGLSLVGQATTGEQTLAELAEAAPDLLLLDVHLPDSNAFLLLDAIRMIPQPPVIALMTLEASEVLRRRAAEHGALFFDKASEAGALLDLLSGLGRGTVTLAEVRQSLQPTHQVNNGSI